MVIRFCYTNRKNHCRQQLHHQGTSPCQVLLLRIMVIGSGKCGDDVYWKLTSDGTMTLSGSGPMYDYNYCVTNYPNYYSQPEWWNYNGVELSQKITSLVVEDGITSIGSSAFYWTKKLKSVSLPNTIESIGFWAFTFCPIEKFNMPQNIKEIGTDALSGMQIEEVVIPGTVKRLNMNTFYECTKLKKVIINDGFISIGLHCFKGCSSLEEVSLPESLQEISSMAFHSCSSLKTIDIGQNVGYIGGESFAGCGALAEINIDLNNRVYASEDGVVYNKEKTKLMFFPGGKTECNLPSSLTGIQDAAFAGCQSLKSINVDPTNTAFAVKDGLLYSKDFKNLVACPAGLSTFSIDDRVEEIGAYAIYGNDEVREIKLPDAVTKLGKSSFAFCSNLAKINLPDAIKEIPYGCFECNFSLEDVNLPTSLERIGSDAFNHTNLKELNLPEGLISIGYGAFDAAIRGITTIVIPSTCTEIENYAFNQSYEVETIISKALVPPTIYERTFNGCGWNGLAVYVPASAIDAYKSAPYWKGYDLQADVTAIEDVTESVASHKNATRFLNINGTESSCQQNSFIITTDSDKSSSILYVR